MVKSLENVYKTIEVKESWPWWRKLLAFAGPGYMVAVGYMDPGNWATDLAGGSLFGYKLISVILLSNIMAMILQHLTVKMGVVMGKDLAQASKKHYSPVVGKVLWILAEIAIIACDLAEVIGSAIAIQLLFGIPILLGVLITSLDTFVLIFLQNKGLRYLEIFVISLITLILFCFGFEMFISRPEIMEIVKNIVPTMDIFKNPRMLYIAIGILGATVMPHNLYLHSALVQSRSFGKSLAAKREAVKYATIDSTFSLAIASLVNCAILILSAATFFRGGLGEIAEIQEAHTLLTPLLGTSLASTLFALALLASGHNSTITGTIAGQVVMEGFVDIKLKPWLRRLITRIIAIVPATLVIMIYGDHGLAKLLVFSQVILSLQLPFAVIPLVTITSKKSYMGSFANKGWLKTISWLIAGTIVILNSWLIYSTFWGI